jgi:putative FmdB family regulatory protein
MPIYEYLCTSCGHRTDLVHAINDAGPTFCPSCGAEGTMRKQFAPPAIHYKGSGWAKKDRGASGSGTRASDASTRKSDTPAAATTSATTSDAGAGTSGGGSGKSDSSARDSATSAPGGNE